MIDSNKFLKVAKIIVFGIIIIFPVDNRSLIPSIPLDSYFDILGFLLLCFIFYFLTKTKNKYINLAVIFIFFLKLFILISPVNLWAVCYQDDITPRTTRHKYTDRIFECEKSYQINFTEFSHLEKQINFESIDEDYEFLGANNSTFKLNFLNNKKFNHRGQDNLLRSWLPFESTIYSPEKIDYKYIRVEFIGELEIYEKGKLIFVGEDYKFDYTKNIEIHGSQLIFKYEFNKDPPVLIMDTLPKNYPIDRYAHLTIFGSDNLIDWEIVEAKNSNLVNLINIFYGMFIVFFTITAAVHYKFLFLLKEFLKTKKEFCFCILILLTFIQFPDLINLFPKNGLFDSFTILIYLSSVYVFYKCKPSGLSLFIYIFICTYLLLDGDFKYLELYIRAGGTDALTYESYSRDILEGDYLRGGESIYFNSPGVRYFLFLLHILFGPRLQIIYILLSAVVLFCLVSSFKNESYGSNPITYLIFIYLTSNALNRIFINGMSEIYSLFFVSLFFYLNKKQTFKSVLLGLSVFVRPILAVGMSILILQKRNIKQLSAFLLIVFIPLLHNFYFGNEFVLFTSSWNSRHAFIVDDIGIGNLISSILETASNNIKFVIMNPFSYEVFIRVGRLLPFTLAISFLILILSILVKKSFSNETFLNFLCVSLLLAPFLIYNPTYFYPRFVMVPHVMFMFFTGKYFEKAFQEK